jgi:hypothetical protein
MTHYKTIGWVALIVSAIGIVADAAAVPENNLSLTPAPGLAASSTFVEFIPPRTTYWSNFIYHPTGKLISEIPIAAIDSTWCAADTFTNKMFPRDIAEEMESKFSEYGFYLDITNFKAGSKKHLDALVGACRDCKTTQT